MRILKIKSNLHFMYIKPEKETKWIRQGKVGVQVNEKVYKNVWISFSFSQSILELILAFESIVEGYLIMQLVSVLVLFGSREICMHLTTNLKGAVNSILVLLCLVAEKACSSEGFGATGPSGVGSF